MEDNKFWDEIKSFIEKKAEELKVDKKDLYIVFDYHDNSYVVWLKNAKTNSIVTMLKSPF